MDKKIFCVSLLGTPPAKAIATYIDDQLVVVAVDPIKGAFGTWKKTLLKEIKTKFDDGYSILVEERGDMFSEWGQKLLLEAADPTERRANMSIAFDHYFTLSRMGRLVLNKGLERHLIQESHVNIVPDDNGRNKYDIDHNNFNGFKRCLLLCSLSASHMHQTTDQYLDEFFSEINVAHEEPAFSTLRRITIERDRGMYED